MVTNLVKETLPQDEPFSRERMQLEVYCSSNGKVLPAHLPPEDLKAYRAGGKLIALTERSHHRPSRDASPSRGCEAAWISHQR